MRKVLLSLLLAGAAASPALAQDAQQNDPRLTRAERQQARADRQAAREDARPDRSERQAPAARSSDFARPSRTSDFSRPSAPDYQARPDRSFVRQQAPQASGGAYDWRAQDRRQLRDDRTVQQQLRQQAIRDRIDQRSQLRQQTRVPPVMRTRPPVVSYTPRPGTQPPPPATTTLRPATSWSQTWRTDSRYDWRNYRNRHRSLFHLGFYYDPFGWSYQRYNIGWRLWPSYYGSSFWIDDPWYYRLPYAPPGTRWVRYYDDALLVDMWSGEVVDVIYDFFW